MLRLVLFLVSKPFFRALPVAAGGAFLFVQKSGCLPAFALAGRDIVLIVFLVIFAKSGNQIRIICFVGGKAKCTAALTALLHAAVYEMLQILPLVISKQGSQIGVVLFVILIIVNRGVFAGRT